MIYGKTFLIAPERKLSKDTRICRPKFFPAFPNEIIIMCRVNFYTKTFFTSWETLNNVVCFGTPCIRGHCATERINFDFWLFFMILGLKFDEICSKGHFQI